MPLNDLLKARFTSAINSLPKGTWKILITDAHSQALLDTVYTTFDVLAQNVTAIEPLHSPRPPQPHDAVYILTPTSQNVDRVIADFVNGRRTYKSAHLYFIDGIDDSLAAKLTNVLGPLGVLKAFVELYCNFWALEDRVFTLKIPSAFYTMYGPLGGAASADLAMEAFEDDVKLVGRSILNVLATVNENPHIRYYQPPHHPPLGPLIQQSPQALPVQPQSNQPQSLRWRSAMGQTAQRAPEVQAEHLSRKLATQVQAELDSYMEANPDFPNQAGGGRPKAVLFIVDRAMDPVAPFLHEFWYQAMVNDLLPVEDGQKYRYTYTNTVGGKEQKEAIITEADKVWTSVRHSHMKDAIDTLMTDFNKFAQEHAGFRGGSDVNVNDLKDMLASLPQFQAQREQYSLHLDMAQECMSLFEKKKLPQVANVEQCCATGYTSEGKTPKSLVEEMVPLLDDRNMSATDKIRIIALYILFRDGVPDEDRRRLFQHARLSISEQEAVNNLMYLGAKVVKDAKDRSSKTRIKQKVSTVEGEYELSRYRPVIQTVLEDHNNNRLDLNLFPFIKETPPEFGQTLRAHNAPPPPSATSSLRSARPTWHKAPSARVNNTEGKQRLILFVAGGMTYSEMRLAYVIGQSLGKEVFIGSTHVLTPEVFVRDLKYLGRGGIGGNPPNAIPLHPQSPGRGSRTPGRPMTYQSILDKKHWVPPVGPPQLGPPPNQPPPLNQANSFNTAVNRMSDLTLTNSNSSSKLGLGKKDKDRPDGEKKKKGLFGTKW